MVSGTAGNNARCVTQYEASGGRAHAGAPLDHGCTPGEEDAPASVLGLAAGGSTDTTTVAPDVTPDVSNVALGSLSTLTIAPPSSTTVRTTRFGATPRCSFATSASASADTDSLESIFTSTSAVAASAELLP